MTQQSRSTMPLDHSPQRARLSAVGTAAGVVLGLAGIGEARRLAAGDDRTFLRSARTTGPVRALTGALLLARPHLLVTALGADSESRAPRWLVRMVAVREVALGIGLSAAANRHDDPRPWLLASAAIDGAESVVVLDAIARGQLDRIPAVGFAAADVGGALVAAGVLAQQHRRTRRADDSGPAPRVGTAS
jgi:hypothetical protein